MPTAVRLSVATPYTYHTTMTNRAAFVLKLGEFGTEIYSHLLEIDGTTAPYGVDTLVAAADGGVMLMRLAVLCRVWVGGGRTLASVGQMDERRG